MVYFIDSNIFLRFFARESSSKQIFVDCENFIRKILNAEVVCTTSSLVFAEVNWVLLRTYKVSRIDCVESLKRMRNLKLPIANHFDNNLALSLYSRHNIKYIDCLIASIPEIQKKKWTVVSYDCDFDKLGVIRKEPKDV